MDFNLSLNYPETYKIVDSKGNTIMKFRGKSAADNMAKQLTKQSIDETYSVVRIKW